MFTKILIANRGEIACRVIRTARALGYRTVAVYSDADAGAPHVLQADEAVHVGASPAAQSYLDGAAILAAARATGADALHPGYGFLSENAAFAQACLDAGLVFIGPPPQAIAAMGHKALAKRRMLSAGVPCVPGYLGEDQGDERLAQEAQQVGWPLLVKAVAGGGGRGMRLARSAAELPEALAGARREARSAFGDDTLMLERLVEAGRHIEIQVFADSHGNAVHLGERDCTAQRRRQKVIEEAPSPVVSPALRDAMGADAVAAARAVGYVGAGTVEFIVDAAMHHYFLEMNTRLQVEHPVTECITGIDLVEWQLRVAAGQPLPLAQEQIRFEGHAIEARLYSEDPYAGFAPQTGPVLWWRPQAAAAQAGVRIDHGIAEGGSVGPFYDAMVAKVIAHGRDREDAIRRLRAALHEAPLFGPRHNGGFLIDLLGHPAFRGAAMHTGLIDEWAAGTEPLLQRPAPGDEAWCLAAALLAQPRSSGWRSDSVTAYTLTLRCDGARRLLQVRPGPAGVVAVQHGEQRHALQVLTFEPGAVRYLWAGVQRRAAALLHGGALHVALHGATFVFTEPSAAPLAEAAVDPRRARAPVAGVVARVAVAAGDAVSAGQPLVCVEAMKMEMWVAAAAAGRVQAVHVQAGQQVAAGSVLLIIEPDAPAAAAAQE